MTDKAILKLVKMFRKAILGKSSPENKCFIVSSPLSSFLNLCGVENDVLRCEIHSKKGDEIYIHYVLKLKDNRILDATACQFNHLDLQQMPDIYLGEKPDYYRTNLM